MTYDLRTVNDLISTPPSQQPRGAPFSFDSKPENEERRSETLLFRLDTLIGIAEGLAFLHAQGCLHADIAPENAMIRLRMDIDGVGITTNSPTTKLIDFGLAKRVEDNRTSTTVVGRITFLAPEQMVAQGSLGPKVSIRFKNGHPQEGEFCQLSTVNGDDLPFERRDFLRDVEDGQYEVLADNEVPNEVFAQFGDVGPQEVKLEKVRPLYGRVLKPPLTGRDAAQTTLRFSYALDVPMDIFSLGCLVAWSITGGQEDLVHLLREQASVATRRKEVVGQNFCSTLLGDDYRKIANAIDLPRTPEDDEIRAALLDVVCRALIRSEGAYCRRRSSGYSQPAAALAADLKRIRNLMFLMVHTKERFLRQTQQRAATEVARMNRLSEDVDSLSADLSRKDTQLSSVAQKSALWRAGAVLSASVALCLAVALRMAATPSAGPTVEIADQPLVANRSPSDASLLEPPQPEQPPQLIATVQPRTTSLSEFPSAKPPQPERAIVSTPDSVSPDSSAVQPTERIRRSAPVGPRRTAKVGGLPMSNSTVEQIAQQAIDRTAECKAKPSSLKVDGTVTVNFNADASTGKVKKVSIVDVSDDDLRIDEKKCRDLLEGLDFRAASDISEDFKVSLRITKGG